MADRLLVPFAGAGSGTSGLSWGQQTIWREFETMGAPIWLTGLLPARSRWSVEDAAAELAYIMGRYQSLRTRLEVTGDRPVRQTLYDSGEICLQVIDTAEGDDPLQVAMDLEENWKERDRVYDYANDWPVRMALIRYRGEAAYCVRATSHIVTDGFGALELFNNIHARDPAKGAMNGPVTSMEPLEQAEWQAGPTGQRRSRMAEQYWERLLRAIPAHRFGQPAEQQAGSRYGWLTFDSRATYLAVQAIAARTGVATSPVLLAAVAVGMARATGINPVVPRLNVSNRFRPRLATTVSPIAQTCPCVIDVAGISFDETVKRVYCASLGAYKNAYFDPPRIREVVAKVGQDRGEQIDLAFLYNDMRIDSPREADASLPAPRDIQAALPLTEIIWTDRPENEGRCSIEFEDACDTIKALMVIDTQYIGRAQAQACLRELEAIAVSAAFDPGHPTGI